MCIKRRLLNLTFSNIQDLYVRQKIVYFSKYPLLYISTKRCFICVSTLTYTKNQHSQFEHCKIKKKFEIKNFLKIITFLSVETQWVEPWYILVYPGVLRSSSPHLNSSACSLILIPLRHPRYMQFNTHTFKTPQVQSVQYSYLQDTQGICSSMLIHSRHPRYMQFNTHTFKTPQVYAV